MNNPYENLKTNEHITFTYNEFCELTNSTPVTPKQKVAQFNEWSKYMDLTKGYNKITLNKVYNTDEMLLISHNRKFTEYISDLIIMYLANSNKKVETLTYKELAEYLYMVNKNYYKAKYKKMEYIDEFEMHTDILYFTKDAAAKHIYNDMGMFFNITDKIIKEIIRNALKSLENKGLIICNTNFKLYKTVKVKESQYVTKTYICNDDQRKEFLNIRKKIMIKHNVNKLQDIIYLKKDERDSYFKDLRVALQSSPILNNCSKYANAFDIEYGDKAVQYEYKRIIAENKKIINNNLQYKLLTTKELECINNALKVQFIDKFIDI